MPRAPLAAPGAAVLAAATSILLSTCGRPETGRPSERPTSPTTTFALRTGLGLTLVPNLPGVEVADFPEAVRRDVEVLGNDGKALRLVWTGVVRKEKAESARRREDWVRAASNVPSDATPLPAVPGAYEEHTVTGELFFPDFATATSYLLPGLWPEGSATIAGSSALWVPKAAHRDLRERGQSRVPLSLSSRFLKEPASVLLRRATELAAGSADADAADLWTAGPSQRFALKLDGRDVEVAAFTATSWFGTFEILADDENPLVLSVLPSPARSPVLDLFAPVKVLRTLLGYRVAEAKTAPPG